MKIPRDCSGQQLAKALRVLGYVPTRQSGSHVRVSTQRDGENQAPARATACSPRMPVVKRAPGP